jgi:hypothetical protein
VLNARRVTFILCRNALYCFLIIFIFCTNALPAETHSASSCAILTEHLLYNKSKTISLFMGERHDGNGATMQHLLYTISFAFFRGWNFAGVIPASAHGVIMPHHVDQNMFLDFFWGNNKLLARTNYPNNINMSTVDTCVDLLSVPDAPNTNYHVKKIGFDLEKIANFSSLANLDRYFSTPFLTTIRSIASCGVQNALQKSTVFSSSLISKDSQTPPHKRMTVAAHIRHGDISSGFRFVPDEIFIEVLSTIRDLYPYAELHAFTSALAIDKKSNLLLQKYTARNISLHIADESKGNTVETLNDIAHFITADVFIMSKSSFSAVPAFYNPNCVIYIPFWHMPLAHYIQLPVDTNDILGAVQSVREQLPVCINSLTGKKRV